MKTLLAGFVAAATLTFALAGAPASAVEADPTVAQIYDEARAGHLDKAQQMIEQVLRDHPASSKAHYVQAELYAREGNLGLARSELAKAEQLKPGLPDENPRAVQELKSQLGLVRRVERPIAMQPAPGFAAPSAFHIPWGAILILAIVVGVLLMLFRRRSTYVPYSTGGMPGPGGMPGGYGPGGYAGPGGGMIGGGGIGSNIAGGLAGGLAAGAGIVAGEELAHHFLDGNQRNVLPPAEEGQWNSPNSDMGGNDFGVNDPGSWDDNSGGGGDSGGGGGDWS